MEDHRRLVAQLMDTHSTFSRLTHIDIHSNRVCKSFLVSFCPYDLFLSTKQDYGPCPLIHSEKLRLDYENSDDNFDLAHLKYLEVFINELDNSLDLANKRLQHTPEEKQTISKITNDLHNLDIKINLMIQEINLLLANNCTSMCINQVNSLSKLCINRTNLASQARSLIENIGQTSQQKLQVCTGCGAYLSRLDSDRRLADHLVGKVHLAFVAIRREYDELRRKLNTNTIR